MFSFADGTMEWDASRVSAAIPSGVGFLGAGLIWKGTVDNQGQVHGLTTAASVWLSAAVGVACGGQLYAVASFSVVFIVVVLRGFPRNSPGHTVAVARDPSAEVRSALLDAAVTRGEYGSAGLARRGGKLPSFHD